jgi:hypothetical protein
VGSRRDWADDVLGVGDGVRLSGASEDGVGLGTRGRSLNAGRGRRAGRAGASPGGRLKELGSGRGLAKCLAASNFSRSKV